MSSRARKLNRFHLVERAAASETPRRRYAHKVFHHRRSSPMRRLDAQAQCQAPCGRALRLSRCERDGVWKDVQPEPIPNRELARCPTWRSEKHSDLVVQGIEPDPRVSSSPLWTATRSTTASPTTYAASSDSSSILTDSAPDWPAPPCGISGLRWPRPQGVAGRRMTIHTRVPEVSGARGSQTCAETRWRLVWSAAIHCRFGPDACRRQIARRRGKRR